LNVATQCTDLVMFGVVIPEKRLLIFVLFWKKYCKNGHIRPIISEHAQPVSTNYLSLINIWARII